MNDMLRITGLATGMDTDNMVKQMMKPYNMRFDKMKQDRDAVKWKQDEYRDIMGKINTFRSKYFDSLHKEDYMLSDGSYSMFDTTCVNSSGNPEGASAKVEAKSGSIEGNYSVNVTRLAKGASVQSTGQIQIAGKNAIRENKLSDLGIKDGRFALQYKSASGKIESKLIDVKGDMTISDLTDKVKASTNGNVVMNFSELTGKISMHTLKTGKDAILKIGSESSNPTNLVEKLQLNNASKKNESIEVEVGKDAKKMIGADLYSIDNGQDSECTITPPGGSAVTVSRDKNTFSIDGMIYTLNSTGETKVSVKPNTDKAFDKIKGFVEKYNELIDGVSKKLEEKKNRKYIPLTDEQKKAMKEDDIKKWEEKAKQGILRGEHNLERMLDQLRGAFFDKVEESGMSLKELGLSTSRDTKQRGKIVFDSYADKNGDTGEARLKKVLSTRGDQVMKLLFQESKDKPTYSRDLNNTERKTRYNQQGIFRRIDDIFKDYTTTSMDKNGRRGILVEKAGIKGTISEMKNSLFQDLVKREKAIRDFEKSLSQRENRFYMQFAKLEKYMNQMNAQSNWLTSQLGGR